MLGETRRAAIVEMLRASSAVTVTEVQEALDVSPMTVRRDLSELARRGVTLRTHGGAVMPSSSTPPAPATLWPASCSSWAWS
jgi:DeoR family lactose phosphotransferase system repressor